VLFGDAAIALGSPGEYEDALLSGFVIADVEVRRQRIRKALDHVTRTVPGLRWREDHGLVDKLTQLTEWPSVLLGGFEKEFLELPEEVLVTVMRDHQNYFAVEDKDGKLAPHFLAVLNTEADEAGMAVIRHGNERVLRARFNDARFFWEFDQRVPLMDRVAVTSRRRSGCGRWPRVLLDWLLRVELRWMRWLWTTRPCWRRRTLLPSW
jgi:glycyl-tRNA synthetase beta chain